MALTQSELLALFSQVGALKGSDQFLIITANPNGTVSTTKITAETARAYLYYGRTNKVFQTEQTVGIIPNVLNVWNSPVTSLTITFLENVGTSINEYMLEFTVDGSNFTLTLPYNVKWSGEPDWIDGFTYQVSVLDDLAVASGWEADSE